MGKRYVWIFLVLALGLSVRILFLWKGGVIPDSDEAIVGLMAKHINEGREWPIFYYGQSYMGSLEPTLTAFVFRLVGENDWSLKVVPLFSALLFIYCVYLLGEKLGGEKTGIIASLFAALPPLGFVEWSTKTRGGFIELVLLGTIAILISVEILRSEKPRLRDLLVLGFILGLAWWTNNQAIFYLAAIGLCLGVFLLRTLNWKELLKWGGLSLIAFIIGGFPFWYSNLFKCPRFATFSRLSGSSKFPEETLHYLKGFFLESVPILTGATRFWGRTEVFLYSTILTFILCSFTIVGMFALLARREKRMRGLGLLVIFLISTPIIFALSSFGWLTVAPRYLLPLYSAWFVLIALVSTQLPLIGRIIIPGFVLLNVCSNYCGGVSIPGQPFVAANERVSKDHSELYAWLKIRGFPHIRTNYWIGFRVAYETNELVTFSQLGEPFSPRIPSYEDIGRDYKWEAPFVIVPSQEQSLVEVFDQLDLPYARFEASGYVILEPLKVIEEHPVEPIDIELTNASSRIEWLPRLIDKDRGTRWGSGHPQTSGMFIEGKFADPIIVEEVDLDVGFWHSDFARKLSVQLITDNRGGRCSIFEGETGYLHDLFGSKARLPVNSVPAIGIRLEQLGHDSVFDWSVAELKVLGRADVKGQTVNGF